MDKEDAQKKVIETIIEAKRNINKAIHKIIEIAEWCNVDFEIKADLKANLTHINYSIENIFYKLNNEKNEYNFAVPKVLLEYLEKEEKEEINNYNNKSNY